MEFYKKFKREAIGVVFGVGLTLLSQFTYNALKGPDFVYSYRHLGKPSVSGNYIIESKVRGKKQHSNHGNTAPSCIDELMNISLNFIEERGSLSGAGIYEDTPISELRIEIRK